MSRINWPGAAFLVLLAILWEAFARSAGSPNFPAFSTVVATLFANFGAIALETLQTLKRAALGFLIALLIMLPLGVFLGRVKKVGDIVEPVVEFIRPLPQIMAGVRISIATALLLSVVAEMLLAANGLGTFIVRAQERFQIAHNLAALLTIVVLALIINALLQAADRRLLAWHHERHAGHHE